MAVTVIERPSKTLSNDFLSKWSSSELPLQYKFTSDKYPVNNVDSAFTITSLVYDSAKLGVVVTFSANHDYDRYDEVTISATGTILDGGIFSIKNVPAADEIVLDYITNDVSVSGSCIKHYPNYKGLVKIYSGAPDQHPAQSQKPMREIGVIEVDFKNDGVDNIGVSNVNEYIKDDITAAFNLNNNIDAWTSFYIETAETYDISNGDTVSSLTPVYVEDLQDNCVSFTDFDDPSFDNGLTSWNEGCAGGISLCQPWTDGVGKVSFILKDSDVLNQDKTLYDGVTYEIDVDYDFIDDYSSRGLTVLFWGYQTSQNQWVSLSSSSISTLGTGTINKEISPNFKADKVGISIQAWGDNTNVSIDILSLNISTTAIQPCLYSQFAIFGTKQFQDSLGGNFGDYVLNPVNSITPKILTHLEEKTYFEDKPFYFSAIIPSSTFLLSEDNTVKLNVSLFNRSGDLVLDFGKIKTNQGEGVYTDDLDLSGAADLWETGEVRYSIVPDNKFVDGDYGTFENQTTTGITVLPNNGGNNPDQIGSGFSADNGGYNSLYAGSGGVNATSMIGSAFKIITNDTLLSVVEGLTYEIQSYMAIRETGIDPRHLNNGYFYWLPDGYDFSECVVLSFDVVSSNLFAGNASPITENYIKIKTTFTAKTTESLKFTLYEGLSDNIPDSTGGAYYIDTITFKGPIDYISETRKIKRSSDGKCYGGTLRWINDLGGWESWYFSQKKIERENVTDKINITRDIQSDWDQSFISGDTQHDTIKTSISKSITLNSQILTKDEYKNLQQIKRSVRVQYLTDEGNWQTVTTKTTGYEISEQQKDIFEMSITVILPNPLTQAQ
jgi:hypothetical protein